MHRGIRTPADATRRVRDHGLLSSSRARHDNPRVSKTNVLLSLFVALLATVCTESSAQYATRMMPQDGKQPLVDNYTASAFLTLTGDPVADVRAQMRLPGLRMLTTPSTKAGNFTAFDQYLNVARGQQPGGFRWAYVYDEMFYDAGGVRIGLHETTIISAAMRAKAAGMKSAVTILPDVVLHRDFRLLNQAAFDVIGVVVYQGIESRLPLDPSCRVSANPYANYLWCSLQRLRQLGFQGEVWYVFQGFVDPRLPGAGQFFAQQYEALSMAHAHGITGVVNYGYAFDFPYEPHLARGQGTAYDTALRRPLP